MRFGLWVVDGANDSGRSGPVTDGTALIQVHADMGEATAAAASGSSAADQKRKRNDTSRSAKAMRAWLLPPPGGHPPSTTTAMTGAAAVSLGLPPPTPPESRATKDGPLVARMRAGVLGAVAFEGRPNKGPSCCY